MLNHISMKTAILLSGLLIGGSVVLKNPMPGNTRAFSANPASVRAKRNLNMPTAPVKIVVDKSSYELYVYDALGWFATYPVVFGNSSLDDKKMAGDRNTPEGTFRIVNKRVHEKWDRYMGLDYP